MQAEQEEIKASKIVSIEDKIKFLEDKNILILSTRNVDTSSLTSNFSIRDANEYKNKDISLNYHYVVLLTAGLSHAIAYDVQADVKKTKTKLIFSSRTNINLVLDDIIAQL